ncbi:MAG: DUF1016 N-terminal domain-containing protein [Candidatus Omnitrophota bacterium]|nr:DUF1016 N-terminal domain-containing protein [Candidatus Omnitrophota bacterium]
MPKELAKTDGYKLLVSKIQTELTELDFFVKRRTAEGYWRIGRFIHEHLLEHKDRADYGHFLLERLGEDVDRDVSTLRRALKFYRTYPIRADQPELSWDHYKRLITIQDKSKREAFEKMSLKRDWTARRLEEAIRLERLKIEEPQEKPKSSSVKLNVIRSRLFTYRILEPAFIHPIAEKLVIDLGFKVLIHAEIKGLRLKKEDIIESVKEGGVYSFKHSDAAPKELYTYKALVEKVIDADTIWLNIDLGFSCWIREKVRLRGIDAPEITTQKGQEAKEFVEARLKEVDFVIVKTHKSDKYDRYLADIFYPPLELRRAGLKGENQPQAVLEQGTFLNQELLDIGLARKSDF